MKREKTNIAKKILKLLAEKDIRQNELADEIGIHEVTLSRYIHSGRFPNSEVLPKIATALGVSVDYLQMDCDWNEGIALLLEADAVLGPADKARLAELMRAYLKGR